MTLRWEIVTVGPSIICPDCVEEPDPMHAAWDGWLGDCPYRLRSHPDHPDHDPNGTCAYGCWEEPKCITGGPYPLEPPEPRGEPCETCGGIGAIPQTITRRIA